MSRPSAKTITMAVLAAVLGLAGGYWLAQAKSNPLLTEAAAKPGASQAERKVLYWYDPMVPQHKFDKPGKSPFMDMQLVPRYADEGGDAASISIDPGVTQNLGVRLATVSRGEAVGVLGYNARVGQVASARLPALDGEAIKGSVTAVLPEATAASRTLRVRIELPNPDGVLRPGLTASVTLADAGAEPVLLIPSEAVIRTGKRALVMIAEPGGRYRPVEVRPGADSGSRTAIHHGLEEGQQVVASGQFLIDSEASLRGITAAAIEDAQPGLGHADMSPALHESDGRIIELDEQWVKIAHGPFHTLGMPGMTMRFAIANPHLLHGMAEHDRVSFAVRETASGLVIERLHKQEQQP